MKIEHYRLTRRNQLFRSIASLLTIVLFLFTASDAKAQQLSAPRLSPNAIKKVDAAMAAEMANQRVVGLAIGIIQNGEIVYVKGYGFANLENKTPVTAETVFNWASNSKPLAAVAAMHLVEKGLLDLDADVRKYVPEYPDKKGAITTRQLLCHQSGIPHYSNGTVIATKRKYPNDLPFLDPVNALDKFNGSPLLFTPGTKVDYSTYAYILLSAVIQRAGDKPFDRQIQAHIAQPLGMDSLQLDTELREQQHWAVGYTKKQNKIMPSPEEAHYWKHGGGGHKSNIKDFARFAQSLINHELLGKDAERQMWSTQKTSDGKATDWGLGFEVGRQGGLKISHNGLQNEVTTRLVIYPDTREGVVVMCNCDFATPGTFSTGIFSALRATGR